MTDCIFCKIVLGEIPTEIIYEDDSVLVFKDLHPKAPVHWLIIPKVHITSLMHLEAAHQSIAAKLLCIIPTLAKSAHLQEGFKLSINTGPRGGQEIPHLHLHLYGHPILF
jgi:histidine triad (HIT) family protein